MRHDNRTNYRKGAAHIRLHTAENDFLRLIYSILYINSGTEQAIPKENSYVFLTFQAPTFKFWILRAELQSYLSNVKVFSKSQNVPA